MPCTAPQNPKTPSRITMITNIYIIYRANNKRSLFNKFSWNNNLLLLIVLLNTYIRFLNNQIGAALRYSRAVRTASYSLKPSKAALIRVLRVIYDLDIPVKNS